MLKTMQWDNNQTSRGGEKQRILLRERERRMDREMVEEHGDETTLSKKHRVCYVQQHSA